MCDSPLFASFPGVSLMKLWHSIPQRTSSPSTTRSLSSSSLARTTEWVKEACWEAAGKCVCVCGLRSMEDHTIRAVFIELAVSLHCDVVSLYPKSSLSLSAASVPPLPSVGMWGRRLPLCSALSRTCPPRGAARWTSGAAHTERRPHLHFAWAMTLT